jgi:hypothetical protein
MERESTFAPLQRTAARLGVPAAWLKCEAEAGRVPHIKAGRRILFHAATIEQALAERAAAGNAAPREVAHA